MPSPPPTPLVRPARRDDAAAVAAVYQPYVLGTAITFDETPPGADAFARQIDAGGLPFYVAEAGGRVAGYAAAVPHGTRASFRWCVNCAIYVAPDSVGGGLGRALYAALLPRLAALGYVRAYAAITLPNPPSERLHEANGFRPVARFPAAGYKLGAWHDVGWWALGLNPLTVPPAEPVRAGSGEGNDRLNLPPV